MLYMTIKQGDDIITTSFVAPDDAANAFAALCKSSGSMESFEVALTYAPLELNDDSILTGYLREVEDDEE